MIKYTNISYEEYKKLSYEKIYENAYCIDYNNGNIEWKVKNMRHREDGPALIFDGSKYWFINGKRHREDGPAIMYNNGTNYWYLNSFKYSFKQWLKKISLSDEEKVFLILKYRD